MPLVNEVQVKEVLQNIKKLSKSKNKDARELARGILIKWGRIAEFIDTALINHRFWIITIHIFKGDKAVSLTFTREREHGEWVLRGVRFGPRVRWGFKWEYDLGHDKPLVKKVIRTNEVVRTKNIIA